MGLKSVRRKKLKHPFTGYKLYRHHKALAQTGKPNYIPPTFYDAMKVAPPLPGPFRGQYPGKLIFPDDKLKKKIEIKTEYGKEVSKFGISPIPWWFMDRPIDGAVYRIKEIMQHNPDMSEEEAIAEWDWEYHRLKRIREKELELLSFNAQKEGTHLTVLDSFNLIRLMNDLQVESDSIKEYRIQRSRKEQSGIAFEKEFVLPKTTLDFNEYKKSKSLHFLFNTSQSRKLTQAIELRDIIKQVIYIRSTFGSLRRDIKKNYQVTEQDLIECFVKSFEIDKVPATSPEWGKDRLEFAEYEDSNEIYENLLSLYDLFKKKYERFNSIVEVLPDFGKLYSNLDLGFSENPFSHSNINDPYDKSGLLPIDLTRLIQSYFSKKGYDFLLLQSNNLKTLFQYIKLTYVVRLDSFLGFRPNYYFESEVIRNFKKGPTRKESNKEFFEKLNQQDEENKPEERVKEEPLFVSKKNEKTLKEQMTEKGMKDLNMSREEFESTASKVFEAINLFK